jgi:hypothetical protein
MSQNLWLPFWLNIGLLLCAIPTIRHLPETKTYPVLPTTTEHECSDSTITESGPLLAGRDLSPSKYATAFETPPSIFQSMIHAVHKLVRLVNGRRNFQVLLYSFFLTALASSDTKLLVQYISKRYEWTFAQVSGLETTKDWYDINSPQAGYMLSAKAIVNFTLLAIIVPRVIRSSMSSKTVHGSEVRINYLGAELSIAVSVLGVLCVALSFKFWMLLTGKTIEHWPAEVD